MNNDTLNDFDGDMNKMKKVNRMTYCGRDYKPLKLSESEASASLDVLWSDGKSAMKGIGF